MHPIPIYGIHRRANSYTDHRKIFKNAFYWINLHSYAEITAFNSSKMSIEKFINVAEVRGTVNLKFPLLWPALYAYEALPSPVILVIRLYNWSNIHTSVENIWLNIYLVNKINKPGIYLFASEKAYHNQFQRSFVCKYHAKNST